MNIGKLSIDEMFTKCDLVLTVSRRNAGYRDIVVDYNQSAQLKTGQHLYDTAYDLNLRQRAETAELMEATGNFKKARTRAYDAYLVNVKLARIVFKRDAEIARQLGLTGRREKSYDKLYMQMMHFYDIALADNTILQGLMRFNISIDKLHADRSLVIALDDSYKLRLKEAKEAKQTTRDRNEAIQKLGDWMKDYIGFLRVVLNDGEKLEAIGMVVPSKGGRRRKTPGQSRNPAIIDESST
jgi:hypothetical protein